MRAASSGEHGIKLVSLSKPTPQLVANTSGVGFGGFSEHARADDYVVAPGGEIYTRFAADADIVVAALIVRQSLKPDPYVVVANVVAVKSGYASAEVLITSGIASQSIEARGLVALS